MKYTVAATVRNEGPFLLEWIAWQKAIGFDDILLAYNDCTDHSPEMMRALEAAGWCHAVEHFPGKKPPVRNGLDVILKHPLVQASDWFFLCDVDEYLVPKMKDGSIQTFLDGKHEKFAAISVQWKVFGTSGNIAYDDRFLHRAFTFGAREKSFPNAFVKSFLYRPARFKRLVPHVARGLDLEGGTWGEGALRWGLANGQEFPYDPNGEELVQRSKRPRISHTGAQVNHYVTKWLESVEFKMGTSCPLREGDFPRYTDEFFHKHDRNDEADLSVRRHEDQFDAAYAQIMEIPGIKRLHHLCCADYIQAMVEKRGENPDEDLRRENHLKLAAESPA